MVALLTLSIISLGVKPSTIPALNYKANKTEVLHLDNGDIQGVIDDKGEVEIYTGIPYAKPPIGELRWNERIRNFFCEFFCFRNSAFHSFSTFG